MVGTKGTITLGKLGHSSRRMKRPFSALKSCNVSQRYLALFLTTRILITKKSNLPRQRKTFRSLFIKI
jgi:hypothetical protein